MPICIECSYPVSHLYSTYSRADDRSLGKGVRLTQCPRCRRFADKYVEYDFVVLFIDLVLIKPQVYRHLLFNRLGRADNQFDPSIVRLGILLLLFDVYLTWARVENSPSHAASVICGAPIIVQYLFFLSLNALSTLAHHMTVRLLASVFASKSRSATAANTSTINPNLAPANTGLGAKVSGTENAQHVTNTPGPSAPSTPMISCFPASASMTPLQTQPPGTLSGPASPSQSMTPTQENTGGATINSMSAGGASDSAFSSGQSEPFPSPSTSLFPGSASLDRESSPSTPTGVSGTTATETLASGATSPIPPPTPSHPPGPSRRPSGAPLQSLQPLPPPFPASPTAISTALLVSSCAKLFPILLVIWGPDGSGGNITTTTSISSVSSSTAITPSLPSSSMTSVSSLMQRATNIAGAAAAGGKGGTGAPTSAQGGLTNLFTVVFNGLVSLLSLSAADTHLVLLNNIEALYILLGCGYTRAVALAVAGQVARWAVQRIVLGVVGIG